MDKKDNTKEKSDFVLDKAFVSADGGMRGGGNALVLFEPRLDICLSFGMPLRTGNRTQHTQECKTKKNDACETHRKQPQRT